MAVAVAVAQRQRAKGRRAPLEILGAEHLVSFSDSRHNDEKDAIPCDLRRHACFGWMLRPNLIWSLHLDHPSSICAKRQGWMDSISRIDTRACMHMIWVGIYTYKIQTEYKLPAYIHACETCCLVLRAKLHYDCLSLQISRIAIINQANIRYTIIRHWIHFL
jgi:hypothetical protein